MLESLKELTKSLLRSRLSSGFSQSKPDKNLTENSGEKSAEKQRCSDEARDGLVMISRNSGVDIGEVSNFGGGGNTVSNLIIHNIYNLRQLIFV